MVCKRDKAEVSPCVYYDFYNTASKQTVQRSVQLDPKVGQESNYATFSSINDADIKQMSKMFSDNIFLFLQPEYLILQENIHWL